MKIHNIKINGYGKLKDKNINLEDKINVIYGENESGKSTIFNFILNVLYGASKTKKGKDISDFDKYTPWHTEEFSGNIEYSLDNGELYKVYREFKKKAPVIYNKNGDDITSKYILDKNNGNQFFYDQTKIDEELFLTCTAVAQQGSKINAQDKNSIIQKLSNLSGSGNDNISFKKSIDKLSKKQLTEIGTERTQDRPINRINNKLEELNKEKKELLMYKNEKYIIEEKAEKINQEKTELEGEIEKLKEYAKLEQKLILEEEKIKINTEINEANKLEIKELEEEKESKSREIKQIEYNQKVNINTKKYVAIFIVLLVINLLVILLLKTNLKYLSLISILVFIVISYTNINKQKEKTEKQSNKVLNSKKEQLNKIESQLQILKNNANTVEKGIQELKDKLKTEVVDIQKIRNAQEILEESTAKLNNIKVKLHSIELDKNNIFPKLDTLANIEEQLNLLNEEKEELNKKNKSIELAKETLEEAYSIMRENITPKFTEKLSRIISNISKDKYNKIKIAEDNNLMVELETGKNISVELLSTGTIEQLYLSFRIAIIEELTKENMPLILDEVYAYYDDNRLKSMLNYIATNMDKQVIILTCTNREKELLDEMHLEYNYIKLTNDL